MANAGAYPINPTTDVGRVRLLVGDVTATNIDSTAGTADYEMFSDAEIQGFIAQGTSDSSAVGYAYLYMAGQAAKESKSVKDYDLSVDLTKRSTDLRAIAQFWFTQGEAAEVGDAFEIAPIGQQGGAHGLDQGLG